MDFFKEFYAGILALLAGTAAFGIDALIALLQGLEFSEFGALAGVVAAVVALVTYLIGKYRNTI